AVPQASLARTAYLSTKRFLDVAIAGLGLVVTAPLLLLLGYLVKRESPGPAIFRQMRVGEMGRTFVMYKLRTMRRDTAPYDYKPEDETDSRLTPLGRVLRKWSLDELPQLVNILRGEMSLVGPRPEQPFIVERYEPWQRGRLLVRPGLTGWWQVNGRSDKPLHLHTEYDLLYVQNQSLWMDLKILLMTVPAVLGRRGAR
nr:sugar transferase [Anaerolineae bacterium]NIN96727.1 sugar transferase [Anaerolineae bacterium]